METVLFMPLQLAPISLASPLLYGNTSALAPSHGTGRTHARPSALAEWVLLDSHSSRTSVIQMANSTLLIQLARSHSGFLLWSLAALLLPTNKNGEVWDSASVPRLVRLWRECNTPWRPPQSAWLKASTTFRQATMFLSSNSVQSLTPPLWQLSSGHHLHFDHDWR